MSAAAMPEIDCMSTAPSPLVFAARTEPSACVTSARLTATGSTVSALDAFAVAPSVSEIVATKSHAPSMAMLQSANVA